MPGGQTRLAKCSPTLNCWCKVMLKDENSYLPSNAFPLKKNSYTEIQHALRSMFSMYPSCTLPSFLYRRNALLPLYPCFNATAQCPQVIKLHWKGGIRAVLSCCALCLQQILLDTVVHYGTVCSHAISCPLKDKNPFTSLCKYLS